MYESFKDYIAVEMLEGENKYDAEKYGLQVSLPSLNWCCHYLYGLVTHTGSKEGCNLYQVPTSLAPAFDEVPI